MQMTELIEKKRDGGELTTEEIRAMVAGYTTGEIPDYQMSSMLMAIYFQGMTERETTDLTLAMLNSGDRLDLSAVPGIKADKHSTGGVGDKTSLVLCPMLAALGVKMAKMSGRGLGHTGGTIDKLESFSGFNTALTEQRFLENLNRVGFVITGQTGNLCPADKKLYALRDVTGTVPSIPLIVGSIMSKKLASGADVLVLDVKTGSGSFMKTDEAAFELARQLVNVGRAAGKKTAAVVTDMDEPLGYAVGNALEVREAISALQGESAGHLMELCLGLGSCILTESGLAADDETARNMLLGAVESGAALEKLAELVRAQEGDSAAVYDPSLLPRAQYVLQVPAPRSGFVARLMADKIGRICLHLGGGRETKESQIDLAVGVLLRKKVGDAIQAGESLAEIHASDLEKGKEAVTLFLDCCGIADAAPARKPFIRGVVR